ncbi:MAG TPA: chromate transporter [Eubacteriales bacterium]|jgi:chromate transporter|nr:chromate transporter [Clostridia bacterium]HRR89579.1 chromate transporter [Eubacteriales bacterium]
MDEALKKSKLKLLWRLFYETALISALTLGGGYVIISLIKKKFVEKLKWIGEDEMLDILAVAQSAPGAMAINCSILVGYRLAGIWGALTAVFATALPPFVIIVAVSLIYRLVRDSKVMDALMLGMQAGIAAVIVSVVIDMSAAILKKKSYISLAVMLISFAIIVAFKVHVGFIILGCVALGIIITLIKSKKPKNAEKAQNAQAADGEEAPDLKGETAENAEIGAKTAEISENIENPACENLQKADSENADKINESEAACQNQACSDCAIDLKTSETEDSDEN